MGYRKQRLDKIHWREILAARDSPTLIGNDRRMGGNETATVNRLVSLGLRRGTGA